MNAHTLEQPADPSSAGTYRYLLAEVLHSTPNGVRMTLARRRAPLSIALSLSRRRLGRRVYFDAVGVAKAIAEAGSGAPGGRALSSCTEDADEAIADAWAASPRLPRYAR